MYGSYFDWGRFIKDFFVSAPFATLLRNHKNYKKNTYLYASPLRLSHIKIKRMSGTHSTCIRLRVHLHGDLNMLFYYKSVDIHETNLFLILKLH